MGHLILLSLLSSTDLGTFVMKEGKSQCGSLEMNDWHRTKRERETSHTFRLSVDGS